MLSLLREANLLEILSSMGQKWSNLQALDEILL